MCTQKSTKNIKSIDVKQNGYKQQITQIESIIQSKMEQLIPNIEEQIEAFKRDLYERKPPSSRPKHEGNNDNGNNDNGNNDGNNNNNDNDSACNGTYL